MGLTNKCDTRDCYLSERKSIYPDKKDGVGYQEKENVKSQALYDYMPVKRGR